MTQQPLITPIELQRRLSGSAPRLMVVDCRFELSDPSAGRRGYDAGHIPGASYVHLEDSLSAPRTGCNGRHPMPERAAFAHTMAQLGVDDDTLVVGYDDAAGMYAARLWWMLRWAGHARASVLDGGFAAWKAEGLAVECKAPSARPPGGFTARESLVDIVDYDGVKASLDSDARLVLDARAADRFRGENETLDPVGGHIPGARNRLFRNNLGVDGRFKPAADLRVEFAQLLDGRSASAVIHQCGSGVTACHNLLAMEIAGLSGSALYPGSWSEWCAQPGAPIATGEQSELIDR